MRSILQYFDHLSGVIENSGSVDAEVDFNQVDRSSGLVDAVLYFSDGSRLELTESVTIRQNKPLKQAYRYEYVQAGHAVFRYDNAPHHPELSSYPHHKHIGLKILDTAEPTLS